MKLNKQLFFIPKRFFAPPKPAAGGKGGPPSSAPAPPEVIKKTDLEILVEKGHEFPLGPPPGYKTFYGAHRDFAIPKLEPRIEVFAKKLRDYYIREGVLPEAKTYLSYERDRE